MEDYNSDYYASYTMPTWVIVLCLIVAIIGIAGIWKVFVKAGQPGWACIIPIYNIYIMTKIGGKPGIWTLLALLLPFIFYIWILNMISKSFGKDEAYTVGLVFFGAIFWPILGFGNARYRGPYGNPAAFKAYQEQHKFDFENKA
jgi:hypothetical protein